MARIEARCAQTLPYSEARQRAEEFARRMAEQFGLAWRWRGDMLCFAAHSGVARGIHGELALGTEDVRVTLHVPLLLRLLSRTLGAKADALLRATFAPDTSEA